MPELAEVEFFRKRWDAAGRGQKILAVSAHGKARNFRGADVVALQQALTGSRLLSSEASGKQMVFRFSGNQWLGIHLGMSGDLEAAKPDHLESKHDHLILRTKKSALVFNDPRMFGRVLYAQGKVAPTWWSKLAPAISSPGFSVGTLGKFLQRRSRAPIKAVLLMQEQFPGVGNWMADEILWRASIHPRQQAGTLTKAEVRALWKEARNVSRLALKFIAGEGRKMPAKLNADIPRDWLFRHRWKSQGNDPLSGKPLAWATVGGRTTCWSPSRQKLHR